jgi:5-methyltetrahydropteroyltriglutamate--homocysteine methyltransferase
MRDTKKAASIATKPDAASGPTKWAHRSLQTTVIGSYPFPGWLEFASAHQEQFGAADIEELRTDAVIAAVHDQVALLDVITDGEQTHYDFNLFYGRLRGLDPKPAQSRRFGPPHMIRRKM